MNRKRMLTSIMVLFFIGGILTAGSVVAHTSKTQIIPRIIITEIMQNPDAVTDANGEYFELYNAEDYAVDIEGWILKDNGSDLHTISNAGPLMIAAKGFLVLGKNEDINTNGGFVCDYQYGSYTLGNGDDEIILMQPDETVVDSVAFDGGPSWPDPTGASMELRDVRFDNNNPVNWYTSITTFGDGDFGTPAAENIAPQHPKTLDEIGEDDENGMPVLLDSAVVVSGFVSAVIEYQPGLPSVFLQDLNGDAGVAVVDTQFAKNIQRGDEVTVHAIVGFMFGNALLYNVSDFEVLSTGNVVNPLVITCDALDDTVGERYEGILVNIENAGTEAAAFMPNGLIDIEDATGSTQIFTPSTVDYTGLDILAETFDVVGVITQHDEEAPYWGRYLLTPRDINDVSVATTVDEVPKSATPAKFVLHQNYPNPCNPSTTIRYELAEACNVVIEIYNLLGRRMVELVRNYKDAGTKSITWNGADSNGRVLSTGIYFIRLTAGENVLMRKIAFVK